MLWSERGDRSRGTASTPRRAAPAGGWGAMREELRWVERGTTSINRPAQSPQLPDWCTAHWFVHQPRRCGSGYYVVLGAITDLGHAFNFTGPSSSKHAQTGTRTETLVIVREL
jgi:hypothetical protein